MLGSAPNLEQRIGHRLIVDAVVGRQARTDHRQTGPVPRRRRLPSAVIVQIGDNGPVWYADMQHLRRVLSGVPRVVLVNVRLARSWQNEVNSELKTYVRSWPQAVIANWYTHSSQAMLSDGVHPTIAARAVYASVVVDALEANQPQLSGARCAANSYSRPTSWSSSSSSSSVSSSSAPRSPPAW